MILFQITLKYGKLDASEEEIKNSCPKLSGVTSFTDSLDQKFRNLLEKTE